jgi:hypothetical protein
MLVVFWGSIYGDHTSVALLLPTKYQLDDGVDEKATILRAGDRMFVELNMAGAFWSACGRYVLPSLCTFGNTRGLNTVLLVYATPRLGVR